MTPAISKLTSVAMLSAALATALLGAIGNEHWECAFALALVLLGVRVAILTTAAARREMPWSRLLLPAIILVEGIGIYRHGSAMAWQVRLGTAVVLELAFIGVAIRELRRTTTTEVSEPLEARIARAFEALLPARVARLVAFELVIVGSALRFLIGGWRRVVPAGFTYHRESGLRMMMPVLPLLAIGDVLLLELVFLPQAAAWLRVVVHGVAIYGLIWLVGLYASSRARPHRLAEGRVTLHRGILKRVAFPVGDIASIAPLPGFADDWKKRAYCKGAIRIDMAGPTILEIELHRAARPIGVLGEGAAGTRVLVSVDEPEAFTAAVQPAGANADSS